MKILVKELLLFSCCLVLYSLSSFGRLRAAVSQPETELYTMHYNSSNEMKENQQDLQEIKGIVLDHNNEPIIGASVSVKGTAHGVLTESMELFHFKFPDQVNLL